MYDVGGSWRYGVVIEHQAASRSVLLDLHKLQRIEVQLLMLLRIVVLQLGSLAVCVVLAASRVEGELGAIHTIHTKHGNIRIIVFAPQRPLDRQDLRNSRSTARLIWSDDHLICSHIDDCGRVLAREFGIEVSLVQILAQPDRLEDSREQASWGLLGGSILNSRGLIEPGLCSSCGSKDWVLYGVLLLDRVAGGMIAVHCVGNGINMG